MKNRGERKVLNEEDRDGYKLRLDQVTYLDEDGMEVSMEVVLAVNYNNEYIGDERAAERLVKDYGIRPELARKTDNICSIGYSDKVENWFAWTHPKYPKAFGSKREALRYLNNLDKPKYKKSRRS